jgi:hypothetical protein
LLVVGVKKIRRWRPRRLVGVGMNERTRRSVKERERGKLDASLGVYIDTCCDQDSRIKISGKSLTHGKLYSRDLPWN